MNKNRAANIVFALLMIAINLMLLFNLGNLKLKIDKLNENYSLEKRKLILRELYTERIGCSVDSCPSEVTKNTLVYVVSGNECKSCVYNELQLVKKKLKDNVSDRFIIYVIEDDSRANFISIHSMIKEFNYKVFDQKDILFPLLKGEKHRFMCILTPEKVFKMIFLPDASIKNHINIYLDLVWDGGLVCEELAEDRN